ncbi:MAG: hypothetical protein WD398_06355 [Cyclobacteriaceae bacterium]
MRLKFLKFFSFTISCLLLGITPQLYAQMGTSFPSERKVVQDPVTGVELLFLTSKAYGDSKIYPTHPQWTSDGEWLIFRSNRVQGETMAVRESTGDIIQVTEGGYAGMLTLSRKQMKLYFMQKLDGNGGMLVKSIDLERLFQYSEQGELANKTAYETIHGQVPAHMATGGDMALDGNETHVYFKTSKNYAAEHLPEGMEIEDNFGPRNMGAGPGALVSMDLKTGEIQHIVTVPFQVGHVQTNPWVPGEIIFCWETGGKSPQRTWTVMADGSGLRPLYPEADYEWVTHEAVISKDEVAIAIMGHRPVQNENVSGETSTENPGLEKGWGPSGTREKPTGLAIVNLRTRGMRIEGQTESGSGLWHIHGSPDGKWAVGDDFSRSLYLINRKTREMKMITTGHKTSAQDHPHPTFHPDGDRFQIQSAMLSEDDRTMNICVVKIPTDW